MVRHATLKDIDTCLAICRKASEESDNYEEFNEDICRTNMMVRILNPYSLVLLTENMDGLLVAVATPGLFFSGFQTCNEFLFSESEGSALIRKYKEWSDNWTGNNRVMFCTSFGGEKGERAERLLGCLGFEEIGKQYKVK